MADTFVLEVATPERLLIREPVTEAQIPCASGMIGVLPHHAALLSELGTGDLSYTTLGGRRDMFVSGGWVQVLNNHVRVIAERAEPANEIDVARAERAWKRANERLLNPLPDIDIARALNAARRAEARIAAARAGVAVPH
jgi:F-type H+-transporting ATPase subunit epsilon